MIIWELLGSIWLSISLMLLLLLKSFLPLSIICLTRVLKKIKPDNGGDFLVIIWMFFSMKKESYIKVVAHIHLNKIVELNEKHRHLLNVASSLKLQAFVPNIFWGDCIMITAWYLINRTPSSIFNGKSPLEIILNKKPHINHLRTFGSVCFAKIFTVNDKLASRVIPFVFIGYSEVKKLYKLYNIETNTFFC